MFDLLCSQTESSFLRLTSAHLSSCVSPCLSLSLLIYLSLSNCLLLSLSPSISLSVHLSLPHLYLSISLSLSPPLPHSLSISACPQISFESECASTIAIAKENITRLANYRRVQLEEKLTADSGSVATFIGLVSARYPSPLGSVFYTVLAVHLDVFVTYSANEVGYSRTLLCTVHTVSPV